MPMTKIISVILIPDLMMGLNIGMRYKNIDFAANFYGTFGNDIYNVTKGRYSGSGGQNVWAGTLEKAWHGEGTGNDIPRLSSNDLNLNYNRVSSFYVKMVLLALQAVTDRLYAS